MISREEVQNLAQLARLRLTPAEEEALQADISNILDYVGQVSAVSAEATKEAGAHRNVMRADALRTEGDLMAGKEAALREAFPTHKDGYNLVRKIIQKDE